MRYVVMAAVVFGVIVGVVRVLAQESTPIAITASPVATPFPISETAVSGNWTIIYHYAEFADAVATNTPNPVFARGRFLIVHITAINTTNLPAPFPTRDAIVTDTRGRVFELSLSPTFTVNLINERLSPGVENYQPSLEYPTVLVFDVAKDAKEFTLSSPSIVGMHVTVKP